MTGHSHLQLYSTSVKLRLGQKEIHLCNHGSRTGITRWMGKWNLGRQAASLWDQAVSHHTSGTTTEEENRYYREAISYKKRLQASTKIKSA